MTEEILLLAQMQDFSDGENIANKNLGEAVDDIEMQERHKQTGC